MALGVYNYATIYIHVGVGTYNCTCTYTYKLCACTIMHTLSVYTVMIMCLPLYSLAWVLVVLLS